MKDLSQIIAAAVLDEIERSGMICKDRIALAVEKELSVSDMDKPPATAAERNAEMTTQPRWLSKRVGFVAASAAQRAAEREADMERKKSALEALLDGSTWSKEIMCQRRNALTGQSSGPMHIVEDPGNPNVYYYGGR